MRAPVITREMIGRGLGWETWQDWDNVMDYGAIPDGITDCSLAFQLTVDHAFSRRYGGSVFMPPGKYFLRNKITINNGGDKGLQFFGSGVHATRIHCPTQASGLFTGDAIFDINGSGPSCVFKDFEIGSEVGGNLDVSAIKATGNGLRFNNLWIQGCSNGLYLWRDTSLANIRISDIQAELSNTDFKCDKGRSIVFTNCHSFNAVIRGFYLTGQRGPAPPDAEGNIVLSGCSSCDSAQEGILVDTDIDVVMSGIEIIALGDLEKPNYGINIESGAKRVIVGDFAITHPKIAGIYNNTVNAVLIVSNGVIDTVGYYDQGTPWACYGIFSKGNLIASNVELNKCAGYGIYTRAAYNQLSNIQFHDCVHGGSELGGVQVVTGDKALCFDPQTVSAVLLASNLLLEGTSGAGAGKTAIFVDNTAVPIAGNLKFNNIVIAPNHFATEFGSNLSDTELAGQDFNGVYPIQPNYIGTLANDPTPSVKNLKIAKTGGTTAITALDNGVEGQDFVLIGAHTTTQLTDGAALKLEGNCILDIDDTIRLIFDGTNWHEISRTNVTP